MIRNNRNVLIESTRTFFFGWGKGGNVSCTGRSAPQRRVWDSNKACQWAYNRPLDNGAL